jgi:hypothetical protein
MDDNIDVIDLVAGVLFLHNFAVVCNTIMFKRRGTQVGAQSSPRVAAEKDGLKCRT